jgi:hypothetical protein
MEQEITLQQAMQALRRHYGEGFEAGREEGRALMAEALCTELSISKDKAKGVVEDLEQAHSVNWIERQVDAPAVLPRSTVQGTSGSNVSPIMVNTKMQGYWQL